jgi:hypothetical protein
MKLSRVPLPLFLLGGAAMAHSVTQVVVLDPIEPSASPGQAVSFLDSAVCRYSGRLGRSDAPSRDPLGSQVMQVSGAASEIWYIMVTKQACEKPALPVGTMISLPAPPSLAGPSTSRGYEAGTKLAVSPD